MEATFLTEVQHFIFYCSAVLHHSLVSQQTTLGHQHMISHATVTCRAANLLPFSVRMKNSVIRGNPGFKLQGNDGVSAHLQET